MDISMHNWLVPSSAIRLELSVLLHVEMKRLAEHASFENMRKHYNPNSNRFQNYLK